MLREDQLVRWVFSILPLKTILQSSEGVDDFSSFLQELLRLSLLFLPILTLLLLSIDLADESVIVLDFKPQHSFLFGLVHFVDISGGINILVDDKLIILTFAAPNIVLVLLWQSVSFIFLQHILLLEYLPDLILILSRSLYCRIDRFLIIKSLRQQSYFQVLILLNILSQYISVGPSGHYLPILQTNLDISIFQIFH